MEFVVLGHTGIMEKKNGNDYGIYYCIGVMWVKLFEPSSIPWFSLPPSVMLKSSQIPKALNLTKHCHVQIQLKKQLILNPKP